MTTIFTAGVLSAATATHGSALEFQFAFDRTIVFAQGAIDKGSADQFIQFAKSQSIVGRKDITIVFNSPGGNLQGGIRLGRAIRKYGWNTAVGQRLVVGGYERNSPGVCASACVYAFAGGVARSLRANDRIGVHQFSLPEHANPGKDALAFAQTFMSYKASYVREMGVDTRLIEAGATVPTDKIRFLTNTEAVEWGVVTDKRSEPPPQTAEAPPLQAERFSLAEARPTCAPFNGPLEVVGVPDWDHLNIRAEPRSTSEFEFSNIIAKLPGGARGLYLLEDCSLSQWCLVRHGCVEGYAAKRYLAVSPGPGPTALGHIAGARSIGTFFVRGVMPGDFLNVRESPNPRAPVVARIPHNEQRVSVERCGWTRDFGAWCFINYAGRQGWAHGGYLLSTTAGVAPRVELSLD